MPPLTDEERENMRLATYHAAQALADDLQHIRSILGKLDPTPGDVRRMSAWLRRILVDADITKVAAPRIGRIRFDAPDLRWSEQVKWMFLAENATTAFGIETGSLAMIFRPSASFSYPARPLPTVRLGLDTFLAQKVLSLEGGLASRGDAIKFVANKAHGVHSTDTGSDVERMLKTMRHLLVTEVAGKETGTRFTLRLPGNPTEVFKARRREIDCVQMNMVATARILVDSQDVIHLERVIAAEY